MALKGTCKSCKKQIPLSSTICPECGIKNPFATIGSHIFTAVVLISIFGGLIYACTPEEKTPEEIAQAKAQQAEKACRDETMFFVMSQDFVKQQLKSPSTAKFPYISDSNVSVSYLGDCTNLVVGYVDAQNSFGATIRNRYAATLQYNSDKDNFRLLDIAIE